MSWRRREVAIAVAVKQEAVQTDFVQVPSIFYLWLINYIGFFWILNHDAL
jgi:hypothetical protein